MTSDDLRWTQWQESVVRVSTTGTVGSCQLEGSIRCQWVGIHCTIQPILRVATLRTQLPVAVHITSRRQAYRRHPQSHQRSWQPPRNRPRPDPRSIQHASAPSHPSQPRCSTRPVSLLAGFPGFGTHATNLTALDQYIEQAAVRIQRAFRRLSKQRGSKCLGSTVARLQPLTVNIQPEARDEGDLDSKVDSSVADTEASQASTLLACRPAPCLPGFHSFISAQAAASSQVG
jgi:hypothetical protein